MKQISTLIVFIFLFSNANLLESKNFLNISKAQKITPGEFYLTSNQYK